MKAPRTPTTGAHTDTAEPPVAAEAHLSASDARMRELVSKVGPVRLPPKGVRSTFNALAESIVYQQLHAKAAATIHARVCALFEGGEVHPAGLLVLGDDALRGAGLSRSKMLALRDLAERTVAGTVPTLEQLDAMSDDAIVESLVTVRGIGRWTAEMLLIFRLGRPDVLPATDYGVRSGFMLTYGKRSLPSPEELARHGERWRPHRTAASWYLWRAADLAKAKGASANAKAKAKPARAEADTMKAKAKPVKATQIKAKHVKPKTKPAKATRATATRGKAIRGKARRR